MNAALQMKRLQIKMVRESRCCWWSSHVKSAARYVANVRMSPMSVAQFTAFVSMCSSEDFHKYDTRNIRPGSLPFSWHHWLILAGSHLLPQALRFHWPPQQAERSICADGGPVHVKVKAAAFAPQISRRDKHLWNVMCRLTFINYHSWT